MKPTNPLPHPLATALRLAPDHALAAIARAMPDAELAGLFRGRRDEELVRDCAALGTAVAVPGDGRNDDEPSDLPAPRRESTDLHDAADGDVLAAVRTGHMTLIAIRHYMPLARVDRTLRRLVRAGKLRVSGRGKGARYSLGVVEADDVGEDSPG